MLIYIWTSIQEEVKQLHAPVAKSLHPTLNTSGVNCLVGIGAAFASLPSVKVADCSKTGLGQLTDVSAWVQGQHWNLLVRSPLVLARQPSKHDQGE